MSDEHDYAQDIAAREREVIIASRPRFLAEAVTLGGDCEDCGAEIPADRRKAAPGASRCVRCQAIHERGRR